MSGLIVYDMVRLDVVKVKDDGGENHAYAMLCTHARMHVCRHARKFLQILTREEAYCMYVCW
jgi:hypothetical protein